MAGGAVDGLRRVARRASAVRRVGVLFGDLLRHGAAAYALGAIVLGAAIVALRRSRLPLFVEQLITPALIVGAALLGWGCLSRPSARPGIGDARARRACLRVRGAAAVAARRPRRSGRHPRRPRVGALARDRVGAGPAPVLDGVAPRSAAVAGRRRRCHDRADRRRARARSLGHRVAARGLAARHADRARLVVGHDLPRRRDVVRGPVAGHDGRRRHGRGAERSDDDRPHRLAAARSRRGHLGGALLADAAQPHRRRRGAGAGRARLVHAGARRDAARALGVRHGQALASGGDRRAHRRMDRRRLLLPARLAAGDEGLGPGGRRRRAGCARLALVARRRCAHRAAGGVGSERTARELRQPALAARRAPRHHRHGAVRA